jgi:hypothetical protein
MHFQKQSIGKILLIFFVIVGIVVLILYLTGVIGSKYSKNNKLPSADLLDILPNQIAGTGPDMVPFTTLGPYNFTSSPGTISAWINLNPNVTTNTGWILGNWGNTPRPDGKKAFGTALYFWNQPRYMLEGGITNSSNKNDVYFNSSTDNFENLGNTRIYFTPNARWYNVVFVVDKANNQTKLYVNGKKVSVMNGPIDDSNISYENIRVGYDNRSPPFYFNGKLSTIKAFSSVLSDSQISKLYDESKNNSVFKADGINEVPDKWNLPSSCSSFKMSSTGVSESCYKDIWKSFCTNELADDWEMGDWHNKQTMDRLIHDSWYWSQGYRFDGRALTCHRKQPYEKYVLPSTCSSYNYDSTGISDSCYKDIWGMFCPNKDGILPSDLEWKNTKTVKQLIDDSVLNQKLRNIPTTGNWANKRREERCYGSDTTKWPSQRIKMNNNYRKVGSMNRIRMRQMSPDEMTEHEKMMDNMPMDMNEIDKNPVIEGYIPPSRIKFMSYRNLEGCMNINP